MDIGVVGLGRMGLGIAQRLLARGFRVEGFDLAPEARGAAESAGLATSESLAAMTSALSTPRTIWIMLPAGPPTESAVEELAALLGSGDIVVDGGNSYYKDSVRRSESLRDKGIRFVDVGTSGGIYGSEHGFCLMAGGEAAVIERIRPVLEALAPAPERGWGRVGSTGAGHFVKMVHNGIEYGLMAAYAEGFSVLEARDGLDLDTGEIAAVWRHGSVIRSFLLDLVAERLERPDEISEIAPWVPDTGGGRWTVQEALDLDLPTPVLTAALLQRLRSRSDGFAERLLAGLRQQFGGHTLRRSGKGE